MNGVHHNGCRHRRSTAAREENHHDGVACMIVRADAAPDHPACHVHGDWGLGRDRVLGGEGVRSSYFHKASFLGEGGGSRSPQVSLLALTPLTVDQV